MKKKYVLVSMNKIFSLLSILLLLSSCRDNSMKHVFDFDCVSPIVPIDTILIEDYGFYSASAMVVKDDWLIIQTSREKYQFSFLNLLDSTKHYQSIEVGNGPNEVSMGTVPVVYGNDAFIFDTGYRNIRKVCVTDSVAVAKYYASFPYSMMAMAKLASPNTFVTSSYLDSALLVQCDTLGNILSSVSIPSGSAVAHLPYMVQSSAWGYNRLALSDDCRHFACGYPNEGYVIFGTIDSIGLHVTREELYMRAEVASVQGNYIKFAPSSIRHINDATAIDNDYVAFLYSGMTQEYRRATKSSGCRDVLIYTWDGEPCARLQADIDIYKITYDSKRKVLYAIVNNPEPSIFVYDINNYLK